MYIFGINMTNGGDRRFNRLYIRLIGALTVAISTIIGFGRPANASEAWDFKNDSQPIPNIKIQWYYRAKSAAMSGTYQTIGNEVSGYIYIAGTGTVYTSANCSSNTGFIGSCFMESISGKDYIYAQDYNFFKRNGCISGAIEQSGSGSSSETGCYYERIDLPSRMFTTPACRSNFTKNPFNFSGVYIPDIPLFYAHPDKGDPASQMAANFITGPIWIGGSSGALIEYSSGFNHSSYCTYAGCPGIRAAMQNGKCIYNVFYADNVSSPSPDAGCGTLHWGLKNNKCFAKIEHRDIVGSFELTCDDANECVECANEL